MRVLQVRDVGGELAPDGCDGAEDGVCVVDLEGAGDVSKGAGKGLFGGDVAVDGGDDVRETDRADVLRDVVRWRAIGGGRVEIGKVGDANHVLDNVDGVDACGVDVEGVVVADGEDGLVGVVG